MIKKSVYIQEIEDQIANWKDEIYKLRIIAEDTGWKNPDRQINYYQIIEDLTTKEKVDEKLSSLKDDDFNDWEAAAHEIDALCLDIEKSVTLARSSVT